MAKLGIVMDPIQQIHIKKDTSFAMLVEAQRRGYELHYMEPQDIFAKNGEALAISKILHVKDDPQEWFEFLSEQTINLTNCDVILLRKDPPVDKEYIHLTQLLELAEKSGTLIVNKPQSVRDVNEKVFISWFPHCCVDTLITSKSALIKKFLKEQKDIICKPISQMGGIQVFRLRENDPNINVILETLTKYDKKHIMAQRYIPEISQGDKRILLIGGKPFPYALARLPKPGETRANLAAGGQGKGQELSARDHFICELVGPILKEKGLLFVGLDVIGDYLTEINVTSPTCVRELDKIYQTNICASLFDCIEKRIK